MGSVVLVGILTVAMSYPAFAVDVAGICNELFADDSSYAVIDHSVNNMSAQFFADQMHIKSDGVGKLDPIAPRQKL